MYNIILKSTGSGSILIENLQVHRYAPCTPHYMLTMLTDKTDGLKRHS